MLLKQLKDDLLELWGDKSHYFGFQLNNPQTGESVEFQSQKEFHIASAYKVFILGELLRQFESGELSLEETIALSDETRIFDSSYTDKIPSGTSLSVLALANAMMGYSDNTATQILQQQVGPANIKALLQSSNIKNTRFPDSLIPLMEIFTKTETINYDIADHIFKGDLAMISTPADLTEFYLQLFSKQFFQKPQTLKYMKEILSIEDAGQRIQWPEGVICYRKSGNIDVEHYFGFSLAGVIEKESTIIPFALCLNFGNEESGTEMLALFKKSFGLMKAEWIKI